MIKFSFDVLSATIASVPGSKVRHAYDAPESKQSIFS